MPVHSAVARNFAEASENKIHSDDIARRFGFTGALVPGVAVFGHLAWPLTRRFGERWLRGSWVTTRFIKPAYDSETISLTDRETGADGIAVEGMRLIKEYLPRAVANGADIEARAHMLIASSMGATAFQKGLGAMHSLSHPCSANLNTHHGLTNAVVMPYVLVWNRKAIADKLARLAAYLGLQDHSFEGVQRWILELREQIGIPHTLQGIGVQEKHAKPFAPQAFNDPSTGGNPVPMSEQDFERLYLRCIRGEMAG